MKQWKTVLVTTVIVLLIAALFLVVRSKSLKTNEELSIEGRIKQYKLIRDEQELITEIMTLRYEAALIRSKINPVPDANTP